MEGFGCSGFDVVGNTVRKKRSNTSRRPRPDSQSFPDSREQSSTPPSDNVSKVSSDENTVFDTSSRRKEFNLNEYCASGSLSINRAEGETAHKKIRKDYGALGGFDGFYGNGGAKSNTEKGRSGSDFKRSCEGVLAPANWKSMNSVKESFDIQSRNPDNHIGSGESSENQNMGHSGVVSDGLGNENKLRKVKLKVGGVIRTIHAKTSSDGSCGGVSFSMKSSRSSDLPRPRPKLILQDNSDDDQSPPSGKASGLQKDFSRGGISGLGKVNSSRTKIPEEGVSGKLTEKSEPVRKSKRVPKRRVLDGEFNDENGDEETRYLGRLKTSKVSSNVHIDYGAKYEDNEDEVSRRQRKFSRVSKIKMAGDEYDDLENHSSRSGRDAKKKSRMGRVTDDTDYVDDEESASDDEPEAKRKKQQESADLLMEGKKEMALTTRQRALKSGKDITTGSGAGLIEFPNGLPPAPPRKQKEKLSEVEQQLKKAEAAQRRRMQVEKAARESEAEAIRKILGQDSNRKKREDKMKKQRDELAQEKAAKASSLASNTIRWVMGPSGTTVTFPKDVGLPSIFDPNPCSYPPPREKCAGPSCTNTYKYRDSKSKLPLCSLQCYRAINRSTQPVSTC